MSLAAAQAFLVKQGAVPVLIDLLPKLEALLPESACFTSDTWDLIAWKKRPGRARTSNVHFSRITNDELRVMAKVMALHKRLTGSVSPGAIKGYVQAFEHLDVVLNTRLLKTLTNLDFHAAESDIRSKRSRGAPFRCASQLQLIGGWINRMLDLRISYRNTLANPSYHGRKASDENRGKKLIDGRIISDLIATNARDDLIDKDRFYLSAFTILVATGFRINELATMPEECMLDDGEFKLLFYPEKHGVLGARYIPVAMKPAVVKAIEHILELTRQGRAAARLAYDSASPDWHMIIKNDEAISYFAEKFAHEWTSVPINYLLSQQGAWWNSKQRYVDVLGAIERNGGNKSAAAKELETDRNTFSRLEKAQRAVLSGQLPNTAKSKGHKSRSSWDTDVRVISLSRFQEHVGIVLKTKVRDRFRSIIEEAQAYQLRGEIYPRPKCNEELEARYQYQIKPVVMDGEGDAVLWIHDALFVTLKYQFSESWETKKDAHALITDKDFSRWLNGEARSHGTGNIEDSCFSRLGIIDPETDDIAKFISHEIRHWLHTMYAEGGMSEQMIALLFGRKPESNHVYDQTDRKTRLENLRNAVRDGQALGHLAEAYSRLAEQSREEAEQYLKASTLMATLMPHGLCTLNWAMSPCPHSLSCFSAHEHEEEGPCEHLHIDVEDASQTTELERIRRETGATLGIIPEDSPQHRHFVILKKNIETILDQCSGCGCGRSSGCRGD